MPRLCQGSIRRICSIDRLKRKACSSTMQNILMIPRVYRVWLAANVKKRDCLICLHLCAHKRLLSTECVNSPKKAPNTQSPEPTDTPTKRKRLEAQYKRAVSRKPSIPFLYCMRGLESPSENPFSGGASRHCLLNSADPK